MEQIFLDLEKKPTPQELLKRIHLLTGMTVTLYNSYKCWVASYPTFPNNVCKFIRSSNEYCALCRKDDTEIFDLCTKKREMIIYRCYMGFYEIMIPFFDQEKINGYIMLGQVADDSEETQITLHKKLREAFPDATDEQIETAIENTPVISKDKLTAIAQMVQLYAEYIGEMNMYNDEINTLANLVSNYIHDHLTDKITNAELCYVFLCDRKKLTKEFKATHGMTIVEYTNNLRLRKARQMLHRNPDLSISFVSSAVGFSYQSYFSTLFYNKYGITPTEMQLQYKKELEEKKKEGEKI